MSKAKDNVIKIIDTMNNIQYELEDIRDLTRVLYVSLKNQVSYDNAPIGITIDEGKSVYPVGEGLSELARQIELKLDTNIQLIEDTYKKYVKEEDN